MNNHDQLAAFSNYVDAKNTDAQGNMHFKARIIYKWQDKMQQDVADVDIIKDNAGIHSVTINNAHSLHEAEFVLNFSTDEQTFRLEADNTILIITGSDNKLQGAYSVEVIPQMHH